MKKFALIVIVLVLMAASAGLGYAFALRRPEAPADAGNVNAQRAGEPFVPVAVDAPAVEPSPEAPPAPSEPIEPADVVEEEVASPPVAYFPPPTTNLTGATLGHQRVPGLEEVGDIYQVYWHDKTQALFMAAVEADGLRAVWRLGQDGKAERVFAADTNRGEIRLVADSKGVMYVMHNNPARVYRTGDAFKTWQLVLKDVGMFWNIADDGNKTVYGALHGWNEPILYRSPDDGFSWEPWIDFHQVYPELARPYAEGDDRFKLRHLHDVIYNPLSDLIIVGYGDVARGAIQSADGGKTWQKVWDEGFTAHTVVGGGNRYLLCPDRLRGPGIVLYDVWGKLLREVWRPGPHNFAGYCYSIINVDGIYYAALHTEANEVDEVVPKFGIIASPDAVNWYPFLEWGPLTNHARTNVWLAAAPARVYASINGALYAFRPLEKGWFVGKTPFAE